MKIFLDENFGITETDLEEVTQDSDGYNILKCYVPGSLVSAYDSFGAYYAAVLPSSRKVGYFALVGQSSSDEEGYTLYQASLHTSVVSIAGIVQLGFRFLYGDSGDTTLKQKTTPVIQFPVRNAVSVNNDILILDDNQDTTDVLASYKNLLENALATYVTIASLATSVTTEDLTASDAEIDALVVNNSVSMGRLSGTTVGSKSTTLGTNNTASATNAYAEGYQTQASGLNSHAEGNQTKATNSHSHAEGSGTKATGNTSHAEGAYTEANGGTSHAEGYYSVANTDSSHAEGAHTIANGVAQHVGGKYNVADTTSLEIIGNGTADNARSNARKLDASGNETLAGDLVYNGNTSLTSKMATKADSNNPSQHITASVYNSIGGYFYITGPNATTQYYSDRIYNSTNNATWLFPSTGGTFALTSQIASAKSELQTQITANANEISTLKSVQNVVDVVATYANLSSVTGMETNDKVQVIADETHNGASTIYNWNGSAWQYVGAYGGNSYTKTETDSLLNAKASKNGSASEDFATDDLTVSGTATITGNTTIGGTTNVGGDIFLDNTRETYIGNEMGGGVSIYSDAGELSLSGATVDLYTSDGDLTIHSQNGNINLGNGEAQTIIIGSNTIIKDEAERFVYDAPSGELTADSISTYSITATEGNVSFTGNLELTGNVIPTADSYNLGSSSKKFANVYADNITTLENNLATVKTYTDNAINDLRWELGSHTLDVESDTTTAYTKTVPSGAIGCQINKIGGMSWKINQLFDTTDYTLTRYNVTISRVASTHTITITTDGIASNNGDLPLGSIAYTPNHKYLLHYLGNNTGSNIVIQQLMDSTFVRNKNTSAGNNIIFNYTETDANKLSFLVGFANGGTPSASMQFMIFDLTDMGIDTTDVATATSELLKRGIDINEYQAYDSGSIRDTAVTSVVSKDSNDTTIDTFTIDSNIQALDGYGRGANDTCYNYIDNEIKKLIKKVGMVDLSTIANWEVVTYDSTSYFRTQDLPIKYVATTSDLGNVLSDKFSNVVATNLISSRNAVCVSPTFFNVITDGSSTTQPSGILYYELATPVETDISEYLDDNSIEVEPNGTLTFNNTYEQAVPSDIDYLIEEVKA